MISSWSVTTRPRRSKRRSLCRTATDEPLQSHRRDVGEPRHRRGKQNPVASAGGFQVVQTNDHRPHRRDGDRKSTRLNSSHSQISYAVFCLKKKKKTYKKSILSH